MTLNAVSNKVRSAYGIGDYAICLYWSGVGLYLLYFYTDVVGITPPSKLVDLPADPEASGWLKYGSVR